MIACCVGSIVLCCEKKKKNKTANRLVNSRNALKMTNLNTVDIKAIRIIPVAFNEPRLLRSHWLSRPTLGHISCPTRHVQKRVRH